MQVRPPKKGEPDADLHWSASTQIFNIGKHKRIHSPPAPAAAGARTAASPAAAGSPLPLTAAVLVPPVESKQHASQGEGESGSFCTVKKETLAPWRDTELHCLALLSRAVRVFPPCFAC